MKKNPEILYDDGDIIAVNKPAGFMVYPDGFNGGPYLTDWIIEKYPETKKVGETERLRSGEEIARPGIVHRLDKNTSGVLLIARTEKAYNHLKLLFKNREVEKTYHAFVYGVVKKDKGRIDRPIGKSAKNFRLWSAQRGARGKLREAVTDYRVLWRGEDGSFLQVSPLTGRTHQIRVHMKAINHSIVCDPLYAPKRESLFGFERVALHASNIMFKNQAGEDAFIRAPFPIDFRKAFDTIGINTISFNEV